MNIADFEKRFTEFEKSIRSEKYRSAGVSYLNKEILILLRSLCMDSINDKSLIPNIGMGELTLCVENADAYSTSSEAKEMIENSVGSAKINIIQTDFLKAGIIDKYSLIVLFPILGIRTEHGRSEVQYIEKCLSLLSQNGRAVMVLPQIILMGQAYRDIRKKIRDEFSLEAVFTLDNIIPFTGVKCSVLIIENKPQSEKIYMSLQMDSAERLFEGYKKGEGGFYVSAEEVHDRFDAYYYDPQYKEVRNLIQRRDTVKLSEIADIYNGIVIPSEERKKHGDFLIVKPNNIQGRSLRFTDEDKVYCDMDYIKDNKKERCILKNGDVLISSMRKPDWAIYHGEDNYAIANQNIAIIRGKQEYEEWLRLFFNTRTGVEALETQLDFLGFGSYFYKITTKRLSDMYIPDIKMMKAAERLNQAADMEAKVASLFRELGWTVEENYNNGRYCYDLALLDNGQINGIVEIKSYKSDQIVNKRSMFNQLLSMKKELGNVALYVFVDDEIYECVDGALEQLPELPRPGKTEIRNRNESKEIDQRVAISIEKKGFEETSLADRLLTEITLNFDNIMTSLNRIEGKVDDITEKLEMLSKQISGYQSLVDKQLELAITADERERILHAFSEECTERIIGEVRAKNSEKEFNTELNKLIISFGENAWKKMDDSSRTFLVSSKVIFNNLINLHDIVDYSGVCLLVTKALEVELSKRFCKNYIAYLKSKYPGKSNYSLFPTPLLDEHGKPIRPKRFTLGSVAYVLCYLGRDKLTEEQYRNNKAKLIEFSKEKLLSGRTDDEIMDILTNYAKYVEKVKNDYRNPSAHTNELNRVDAEQCFALVVDVEKLMKKMLDSFDE